MSELCRSISVEEGCNLDQFSLEHIREQRKEQERDLASQHEQLQLAKQRAAAKKGERIKATKEADDHPLVRLLPNSS